MHTRPISKSDTSLEPSISRTRPTTTVVDNRGIVRSPTVDASSNAKFGEAALESVRKWKYEPAKLNGELAVLVKVEMKFNFD
jgi:TonB family protein